MAKKNRKSSNRRQQRHERKTTTSLSSTAIVHVAAPIEKPWVLDTEQVTILKNAVAKGASDQELQYCLTVARRYKLDPFKKQIWFVKRWDSGADNGKGGRGANVWTPQVGIDGLLFMSARDHAHDFGSVSEPEFGPVTEVSKGVKAPEWARVCVFKRGVAHPTVGTVYWDEYAPDVDKKNDWGSYVAPFWRKMPRRMLAKCATALALRQAYPDLGGVYIPEECERINEDYTASGREIVPAGAGHPTNARAAAQNVLREKLEPLGLWCAKHGCVANQCPADDHTTAELEAFDAAERKSRTPKQDSLETAASSSTIAGAETRGHASPASPGERSTTPKKADRSSPEPPVYKYELTIDWTLDVKSPVLTGNVSMLNDILNATGSQLKLEWKGELWHARAEDVPAIMQIAGANGFKVQEIHPGRVSPASQQSAPGAQGKAKRDGGTPPSAPASSLVSGMIEKSIAGMVGTTPVRDVTLLLVDGKRPSYRCWDKGWFKALDEGVGKAAQLVLKQNKKYLNVVGARKIGSKEWDENGEPAIQKDREAGGKTLFT